MTPTERKNERTHPQTVWETDPHQCTNPPHLQNAPTDRRLPFRLGCPNMNTSRLSRASLMDCDLGLGTVGCVGPSVPQMKPYISKHHLLELGGVGEQNCTFPRLYP